MVSSLAAACASSSSAAVTRTFLTYCIVSVDPPWATPPAVTFVTAARRKPRGSNPLCSKKRESSIAITASCITGATFSSATSLRFSSKTVAILVPSAA